MELKKLLVKLKMYKFITTIFIVLMFSTLVNAANINKVEIKGNKRISDQTILIYGNLKINKDYSEREINKILENL